MEGDVNAKSHAIPFSASRTALLLLSAISSLPQVPLIITL